MIVFAGSASNYKKISVFLAMIAKPWTLVCYNIPSICVHLFISLFGIFPKYFCTYLSHYLWYFPNIFAPLHLIICDISENICAPLCLIICNICAPLYLIICNISAPLYLITGDISQIFSQLFISLFAIFLKYFRSSLSHYLRDLSNR